MPEPNTDRNQTGSHSPLPRIDEPTGGALPPGSGLSSPGTPARVGRYEVRRLLGEGAFGRVYRGFDPELQRDVAIKVPHRAGLNPAFQERFLREARAAATIHHPNVCPIHDVGTDGNLPFLVMHFVPGGTLAGLLEQRRSPFPPRHAVAIARKLALGVAAAHAKGIIHRDLKPQNVLWDEANREVLVTDFGLARIGEAQTSDGQTLGTPAYMAPEQARGKQAEVGPLSDVYSLGVILYRLLTGELPFQGSVMEVLAQAQFADPQPPSAVRPGLDARLDAICLKAMAKKSEERHPSAKALADALADYLRAGGPDDLQAPRPGTRPGDVPSDLPAPLAREGGDRRSPGEGVSAPGVGAVHPSPRVLRRDPLPQGERVSPDPPRRPAQWVIPLGALVVLTGVVVAVVLLTRPDPGNARTSEPRGDVVKEQPPGRPGPVNPPPVSPGKVTVADPEPGEERECEVAPGVRMVFGWVPAGTAQLGSPKDERDAVLKLIQETKEPEWLSSEAEEVRGKFTTKGFWMGKYEVTQAEWAAVMRGTDVATPSHFRVGGRGASTLGGVTDTSRFPVENVSWKDCQDFLNRANAHGGVENVFGKPGRLVLPHEDEWEYACRGGKGNRQPFYFGTVLNGTQANCDGNYPYGTTGKGDYLNRTEVVGKYAAVAPHPWGLSDMHGNVWEWCENKYKQSEDSGVLRGGSWINGAWDCRAAFHHGDAPDVRGYGFGLRVAFRLD